MESNKDRKKNKELIKVEFRTTGGPNKVQRVGNMVVGKGISEGGLSVLHKRGIAVSKSTQCQELHYIVENRPSDQTTSAARNMATILMKRFL